MDFSDSEQRVMQRFAEKCAVAGGAKAGYVLRLQALAVGGEEPFDPAEAVASLVTKEALLTSDDGRFVFLTEGGVEAISA